MLNELPIPPIAQAARSVEMIRVWLANEQAHCVLNIGFWQDRGLDEREAWGILLADMVHHIANAHYDEYGHDREESIRMIRRALEAEMDKPTSDRVGQFVGERRTLE